MVVKGYFHKKEEEKGLIVWHLVSCLVILYVCYVVLYLDINILYFDLLIGLGNGLKFSLSCSKMKAELSVHLSFLFIW